MVVAHLLVTKSLVWLRYRIIGERGSGGILSNRFLDIPAVLNYAVDRLNLHACTVCLCKYHNSVTRGLGSLINLESPTLEKFENFESLDNRNGIYRLLYV
jgi:hypothetical protein